MPPVPSWANCLPPQCLPPCLRQCLPSRSFHRRYPISPCCKPRIHFIGPTKTLFDSNAKNPVFTFSPGCWSGKTASRGDARRGRNGDLGYSEKIAVRVDRGSYLFLNQLFIFSLQDAELILRATPTHSTIESSTSSISPLMLLPFFVSMPQDCSYDPSIQQSDYPLQALSKHSVLVLLRKR